METAPCTEMKYFFWRNLSSQQLTAAVESVTLVW